MYLIYIELILLFMWRLKWLYLSFMDKIWVPATVWFQHHRTQEFTLPLPFYQRKKLKICNTNILIVSINVILSFDFRFMVEIWHVTFLFCQRKYGGKWHVSFGLLQYLMFACLIWHEIDINLSHELQFQTRKSGFLLYLIRFLRLPR